MYVNIIINLKATEKIYHISESLGGPFYKSQRKPAILIQNCDLQKATEKFKLRVKPLILTFLKYKTSSTLATLDSCFSNKLEIQLIGC